PAHWTGARLEAWIDWADGETDMAEAVADYVEELTARAQARGLVKDVRGRTRFRDDLTAALRAGVLAIGHDRSSRTLRVVDAGSPEVAIAVAMHRGEAAAQAAALELERRLQAVMDAILRCEGDAEACADPMRNPGLARAAEAARAAGAPDAMIFEAVTLAYAGEGAWEIVPPASGNGRARLVVAGAPDDATARAAWATGAIIWTRDRATGERIATAERALRGGVSLTGFWTDDGFDIEGFKAAVALLAQALGAASDGPALLGLGGLGDWLAAHGLDYDSDHAREAMGHQGVANPQDRADVEQGRCGNAFAIDERAIGRAEVGHAQVVIDLLDQAMGARHPRVGQDDIGGRGAADLEPQLADDEPLLDLAFNHHFETVKLVPGLLKAIRIRIELGRLIIVVIIIVVDNDLQR
ncbi:MAG: hypothetical protein ABIV23_05520, partial [Sphingomicrobium sp.]